MTNFPQRTARNFAAGGCHRRRFPVGYRNHEKTYIPATGGNEDSIHHLEADIVKLIPPQIVLDAATETKILSRTFTPWSHLLALIYQQLTRTESLNGVCDAVVAFECEWGRMRGAQIPHRNTFSNANRRRDPKMAELVFWRMF